MTCQAPIAEDFRRSLPLPRYGNRFTPHLGFLQNATATGASETNLKIGKVTNWFRKLRIFGDCRVVDPKTQGKDRLDTELEGQDEGRFSSFSSPDDAFVSETTQ